MIAQQLLTTNRPSFPQDAARGEVATRMAELDLRLLPVVDYDSDRFLGMVRQDQVNSPDQAYETLEDLVEHKQLSILQARPEDHLYEVVGKMHELRQHLLPVVDAEGHLLGTIGPEELMHAWEQVAATEEDAAVMVLGMDRSGYSLAEIANITEWEGGRILALFIEGTPGEEGIKVNLKITRPTLRAAVAAYERYGYDVLHISQHQGFRDEAQARFEELMRYLEV